MEIKTTRGVEVEEVGKVETVTRRKAMFWRIDQIIIPARTGSRKDGGSKCVTQTKRVVSDGPFMADSWNEDIFVGERTVCAACELDPASASRTTGCFRILDDERRGFEARPKLVIEL